MPGIEYTLGMKSDEFGKGIRNSMASVQVAGQAIQFAISKVRAVLSDVTAGFASLDSVGLSKLNGDLERQIQQCSAWAYALENPIDALLKLTTGSYVNEAFAEVNEAMALNVKQHTEHINRMLANSLKSADELAVMARRIKDANALMDEKASADASARERADNAAIRAGAAPEDIAAKRADFDAAAKLAQLQREKDAAFKASQEAADNLLQANRNQERMGQAAGTTKGDYQKAKDQVASQQKIFDLARAEYEQVKAIHEERIRGIREETAGRKESLAAEKTARVQKETDAAGKIAKKEAAAAARLAAKNAIAPDLQTANFQRPSADRLAQIGGYVGTAAKNMSNKAAEATAKWTQKTAEYLQKIASNSQSSDGLTFS